MHNTVEQSLNVAGARVSPRIEPVFPFAFEAIRINKRDIRIHAKQQPGIQVHTSRVGSAKCLRGAVLIFQ